MAFKICIEHIMSELVNIFCYERAPLLLCLQVMSGVVSLITKISDNWIDTNKYLSRHIDYENQYTDMILGMTFI